MKKHLPNILLVLVVLANLLFMGMYIRNNGLGLFLNTTGIIFLVLGIIIFIFFLSIDPGYGWIKSIDLTKNYIMIFSAIAVSMAGVVFIVTGLHMNDLREQSLKIEKRCRELLAGNVAEILKEDWYIKLDHENLPPFSIYLFQKKSNRNMYKIIATVADTKESDPAGNMTISSQFLPETITVNLENAKCPGVVEENISIDFDRRQKLHKEHVQFEILITYNNGKVPGTEQPNKEQVLVHLEDSMAESVKKSEIKTELGTQVDDPGTDSGKPARAS